MNDPLTVLLDAIWIEGYWQFWRRAVDVQTDSISGRNVFWVTVMEGEKP